MAVVGSAQILVRPSFAGFQQTTAKQMQSSGQVAGKSFASGMGGPVRKLAGGLGVLFAGAKVKQFFKEGVQGASDLSESGSKVNQIFGTDGAKALDRFSKGSAKSLGQTKLQILDAAATFGTMGKAAGLSGKDLSQFSTGFASLSTDMASFFNTSPAEATEAIGAALRGEAEPIRKYGVLLSDAALKAEAMSLGLLKATTSSDKIKAAQNNAIIAQRNYNTAIKEHGKGSDEVLKAESALARSRTALDKATTGSIGPLTQQQKILAAQGLIYKQTGDAQGDFARTSGGLANQQRILSAQWTDAKTRLGTALLPAVTSVYTALNKNFAPAVDYVAKAFTRLDPWVRKVSLGLQGLYQLVVNGDYQGKLREAFGWDEDSGVVDFLFDVREGVIRAYEAIKGRDFSVLGGQFRSIATSLTTLTPVVGEFRRLMPSLLPSMDQVTRGMRFLADNVDTLRAALPFLVGALVAYKVAQAANAVVGRNSVIGFGLQIASTLSLAASNRALALSQRGVVSATTLATGAEKTSMLQRARATVVTIASTVAQKAATVATRAWAVAQRVLNLVMRANPIGIVITALVALGAGLVLAYRKSETFRKIVDGAWTGIKAAASSVVGWFKTTAWPVIQRVFAGIGAAATSLWQKAIRPAWDGIRAGFAVVQAGISKGSAVVRSVLAAVGAAATFLWRKAVKPAWDGITAGFSAVGRVIRAVWTGFLKPVFELAGAIVRWLAVTVFKANMLLIRSAWSAVGNLVRSVYNNVIKPTITGFATLGKWLWNNVLKPTWALLRAGWALLGSAVRAGYDKVVKPTLNAFATFAKWVWNSVLKPTWAAVRSGWDSLGTKIRDGYNKVVKPILSGFGTFAKWVWERVLKPAWAAIRSGWDTLTGKIKAGYDKTLRPTLGYLGDKVTGLKDIFSRAVEAIGKAWDGLKEAAKKPVRFVVNTVINGLIRGFNGLAEKFGTTKINEIALPKGFARGGVVDPRKQQILAGRSSYRQGDSMLATVRPGEGWTVSEALRDPYERARLLSLNKAALRGETAAQFRNRWVAEQGFAGGGIVWPTNTRQLSGNYPGHSGVDIAAGMGAPIYAPEAGRIAYTGWGKGFGQAVYERLANGLNVIFGHTSKLLTQAGAVVQPGQLIAEVGSTGNSTGAHLHIELAQSAPGTPSNRDTTLSWLQGAAIKTGLSADASSVVGSVVDWFGRMKDKLTGPLGKLKDLASNPLSEMVSAVPRRLASAMMDKAKGWLSGDSGAGTSLITPRGVSGANAVRAAGLLGPRFGIGTIGTYPGHQPSQSKALDFMATGTKLNSIAEYAKANARSLGIEYLIANRRIWNIRRNGEGWRDYFDGRSSDPSRAHTNHLHASFYEGGTRSARRGWAVVGEREPELVNFRGREQVFNSTQVPPGFGGPRGPLELRGHLELINGEAYIKAIAVEATDQRGQRSMLRANLSVGG